MAYYILKSLSSLSTVLEVSLRLIAMSSIQGWPPTASQMVTYIGNLNKKKSSDFDCIPTNLLMQLPLNLFFFFYFLLSTLCSTPACFLTAGRKRYLYQFHYRVRIFMPFPASDLSLLYLVCRKSINIYWQVVWRSW